VSATTGSAGSATGVDFARRIEAVAVLGRAALADAADLLALPFADLVSGDFAVVDAAAFDLAVEDLGVVDLAVAALGVADFAVADLGVADLGVADLAVADFAVADLAAFDLAGLAFFAFVVAVLALAAGVSDGSAVAACSPAIPTSSSAVSSALALVKIRFSPTRKRSRYR
jgi:hypothetical protein